jgi:ubiquinone/menaquinone biosynthesis C-methylase UbiE
MTRLPSWDHLRATWAELGSKDPLWAVVTRADKRGGKWGVEEFLQTGERDVARYHELLRRTAGGPSQFDQVLDFGCGVGRLSLAWSRRARHVTGVDISPGMIQKGRQLAGATSNVELRLNDASDLHCFEDGRFDLVFSHICLQHIPWPITAKYLAEFARVCRTGGWVAFQLPSRPFRKFSGAAVRQKVMNLLPSGLTRLYRHWKYGCGILFDMHFVPPDDIVAVATSEGLTEVHREADQSAGESIESFVYIFKKK